MKNIAIICDSTITLSKEKVAADNIYIAPIMIMYQDQSHLDTVSIDYLEIEKLLDNNITIKTSQPIIGETIKLLDKVKAKNYDHIFMISIAASLSGVYNVFNQAADILGLENFTIFNTKSIAGPGQQAIKYINTLNKENQSIETITSKVNAMLEDTKSYLLPQTLKQVIASGRLSKTAGKIANLLRIKTVLELTPKDAAIERLAVARTDKRLYTAVINDFIKNKVTPDKYDLYILENPSTKYHQTFLKQLSESIGDFDVKHLTMPASLSIHAGNGALAIQWCPKL